MKTIISILFALGLLLANLLSSAQSKSDKIYDTFANKDGIFSLSFSKDMIDAIDIDLGDDDDERNVTGDLHRVRFLSYNPNKGSLSGREFLKKSVAMLPASYNKYEEDEDDDAEIWLLGKRKKYSECHVFVKNENNEGNCFVVSFYGDFTVNDIDNLKAKGREISD